MKLILLFAISVHLIACANTDKLINDPTNKIEVSQRIYERKSEFGEHRIFAPGIRKDYGNALVSNWLTVQLLKTEKNEYFLRIHNYYGSKSYKFIKSITTLDRKTHIIKDIDRTVDNCSSIGFELCYLQELAYIPISQEQYLTGSSNFKFRINSKNEPMVVTLPKEYIQAFIEVAQAKQPPTP